MRAVALSRLGFGPEAEDVVQDAAVVALVRIGELRDPAAAGAWLQAIVRNACRARLRAPRVEPRADLDLFAASEVPSPEVVLDRRALRDWVWRALEELSEPLRLVVLLRYFSGVSTYEQIAALCGVPVGTVRSRLSEAKRRLGDALTVAAASSHGDAAALADDRRVEATEMLGMAERGAFATALAERWSPDLEIAGPNGQRGRGLDILIGVMEGDLGAGVRQRVVDVVASRDVTILEVELLSPRENPNHCPPSAVWLQQLHGGRVERLRLFHPNAATPAARVSA